MQRVNEQGWTNAAVAFAAIVTGLILFGVISDALARVAAMIGR